MEILRQAFERRGKISAAVAGLQMGGRMLARGQRSVAVAAVVVSVSVVGALVLLAAVADLS